MKLLIHSILPFCMLFFLLSLLSCASISPHKQEIGDIRTLNVLIAQDGSYNQSDLEGLVSRFNSEAINETGISIKGLKAIAQSRKKR